MHHPCLHTDSSCLASSVTTPIKPPAHRSCACRGRAGAQQARQHARLGRCPRQARPGSHGAPPMLEDPRGHASPRAGKPTAGWQARVTRPPALPASGAACCPRCARTATARPSPAALPGPPWMSPVCPSLCWACPRVPAALELLPWGGCCNRPCSRCAQQACRLKGGQAQDGCCICHGWALSTAPHGGWLSWQRLSAEGPVCAAEHDGFEAGGGDEFPTGDLSPHRGAQPERRKRSLLLSTSRSDDQEHK